MENGEDPRATLGACSRTHVETFCAEHASGAAAEQASGQAGGPAIDETAAFAGDGGGGGGGSSEGGAPASADCDSTARRSELSRRFRKAARVAPATSVSRLPSVGNSLRLWLSALSGP